MSRSQVDALGAGGDLSALGHRQALLINRYRNDFRLYISERHRRSKVSRILHPYFVRGLYKKAYKQVKPLLDPRGYNYLIGQTVHSAERTQVVRYSFAQGGIAAHISSGQQGRADTSQPPARDPGPGLHGKFRNGRFVG